MRLLEKIADCKPIMAIGSICSIISIPLAVLFGAGVPLPAVLDAVAGTAFAWLPFLTLLTGLSIGWNSRRRAAERAGITAERIAALEAEVAACEKRISDLDSRSKAEEREREAEFHRKCEATYKRLTHLSRPALKVMVEKGEVCLERKYLAGHKVDKDLGPLPRLGMQEVDGDVVRIRPDERAVGVYDVGKRELDLISAGDLEEFAVYDPRMEKIPDARGRYDSVAWWFYSDDPGYDRNVAMGRRLRDNSNGTTGSTGLPPGGKSTGGRPVGSAGL